MVRVCLSPWSVADTVPFRPFVLCLLCHVFRVLPAIHRHLVAAYFIRPPDSSDYSDIKGYIRYRVPCRRFAKSGKGSVPRLQRPKEASPADK